MLYGCSRTAHRQRWTLRSEANYHAPGPAEDDHGPRTGGYEGEALRPPPAGSGPRRGEARGPPREPGAGRLYGARRHPNTANTREAEVACFAAAMGGMDKGWSTGMDLLAELLAELQAGSDA